jgi:pfkB family carbohydrate kinase
MPEQQLKLENILLSVTWVRLLLPIESHISPVLTGNGGVDPHLPDCYSRRQSRVTADRCAAGAHVILRHAAKGRLARRDPGGGGINVARVLKRLGADVVAVYPTGGVLGTLLRQLVADE